MNTNKMNCHGDNEWGLFVDTDINTSSYPEITMKKLDQYSFDKKSSSRFEHCFYYIYYYLGIYVIQFLHK